LLAYQNIIQYIQQSMQNYLIYNNDFYRVYELREDNEDYARIVSDSKKGMYIESTKRVKKILGLNTEK